MSSLAIEQLTRHILALERRVEALETIEGTVDRWQGAINARLSLPGLRGLWPMSAFDGSGNAQDLSGQARHLTYNGNPTYNVSGLAPYLALDGTGDYLSRLDEAGLDITGTESYVASGVRGLTILGWFYSANIATQQGLATKYLATGNQRAYWLQIFGSQAYGAISSTGTSVDAQVSSGVNLSSNQWFFAGLRFEPSTALTVFQNDLSAQVTSSIPASIFNSSADFVVGGLSGGVTLLTGRTSLVSLHAAALSDTVLDQLFRQERVLFGV